MRSIARHWTRRNDRHRPPCVLSIAAAGARLLGTRAIQCRLPSGKRQTNVLFESRAPHTLLALAEAGYGVAIIPSLLRTDRYALRIFRVAHRRKPLREGLVIQWDNRRPILAYAASFREALAEYMREVFPITQPSKVKTATRRQTPVSKARGRIQDHLRPAGFPGRQRTLPNEMSAVGQELSTLRNPLFSS